MPVEKELCSECDEAHADRAVARMDRDVPSCVLHDEEDHRVEEGQFGLLEGHIF